MNDIKKTLQKLSPSLKTAPKQFLENFKSVSMSSLRNAKPDRIFQIDTKSPWEKKLTHLMIILAFCLLGIPRAFTGVTATTLFISRYGSEKISYFYLVMAIVVPLVGYIYLRFSSELPIFRRLTLTVVLLIIGPMALTYVFFSTGQKWPAFAAIIWFELEWSIGGMIFWELAGLLFTARQSKRLFGWIALGEIVALIACGLLIPILIQFVDLAYLFLLSAFGSVLALWVLFLIRKHYEENEILASISESVTDYSDDTTIALMNAPNVRQIFYLTLISMATYYVIENAFYQQAELHYPYQPDLAVFLSLFMVGVGVAIILFKAVNVIFIHLAGIIGGMLILPVFVGVLAFMLFSSSSTGKEGQLVFILICSLRLVDRMLRDSFFRASMHKIFLPFSSKDRPKLQTINKKLVGRLAAGGAGVILLILSFLEALTPFWLSVLLLILCIAWVPSVIQVRKQYFRMRNRITSSENILELQLSVQDPASIDLFKQALGNTDPVEVIYALNSLEHANYPELDQQIIRLLKHPHEEVRIEAVERVYRRNITDALPGLLELWDKETSPVAVGNILKIILALDTTMDSQSNGRVIAYLDDDDPIIRKGAMIGLLRGIGLAGISVAGGKINALIHSENPEDRIYACQILGEAEIKSFYQSLGELLTDPDTNVKRAALRAVSKVQNERLWPMAIDSLRDPKLRNVALQTLMEGGESVVPFTIKAFEETENDEHILIGLVKICSKYFTDQSRDLLLANINYPLEKIRFQVLRELKRNRYKFTPQNHPLIFEQVREEIEDSVWTFSAIVDTGDHPSSEALQEALRVECKNRSKKIFILLGFAFDPEETTEAWNLVKLGGRENLELAVKILENLLPQDLFNIISPLLGDYPDQVRLNRWKMHFPVEVMNQQGRLYEILNRSEIKTTPWTKACALYMVGALRLGQLAESVQVSLQSDEPVVVETAIWALSQCNPNNVPFYITPMIQDPNPKVAKMARHVVETVTLMNYLRTPTFSLVLTPNELPLFNSILSNPKEPLTRRVKAAQILGRQTQPAALEYLAECLEDSELPVLECVLKGLAERKNVLPSLLHNQLSKSLDKELEELNLLLCAYSSFDALPQYQGLAHHLFKSIPDHVDLKEVWAKEFLHFKERLLSIICIIEEKRSFLHFKHWTLEKKVGEVPSAVVAQIKNLIQPFEVHPMFILLQSIWSTDDLAHIETIPENHPLKERALDDWLGHIVFEMTRVSPWLRFHALILMGEYRMEQYTEQIRELSSDSNPMIRETAIEVLFHINPEQFSSNSRVFLQDSNPEVQRILKHMLDQNEGIFPLSRNAYATDHSKSSSAQIR